MGDTKAEEERSDVESAIDISPATTEDDSDEPPLKRVKVEKRVEEVTEGDPQWFSLLSIVNKALLRAYLAKDSDELSAEVNGKEHKKATISLLFEILVGVFKCNSLFVVDGVTGAFRSSLALGPTIIYSNPHKAKKDAKMECAKRSIRVLLTMTVESFWTVQKENPMDAILKKENGTVVETSRVSTNGGVKENGVETVMEMRITNCTGHRCEGSVQRPRSDGVMKQTTMSNLIQEQAYALFHKLAKTCPQAANTHRVLAAIFVQDRVSSSLHCISLATGNKCIKACSLSFEGRAVHDCHAEILTRRGLLRWLYTQVQLSQSAPERSALVSSGEAEGGGGKLRLRKRFSLHLFISTAPCGDGRVFQFSGTKIKDYRNAGRLRHKIEDGEGTILGEKDDEKLSIDSFIMGQRLRTMSCSDKVLKWNVMGLQGSLLSHFIHPIYLSSLTLAHFTREKCVARACYGRVVGFTPSDPEYTVNSSLELLSSTFVFPNTKGHARPKSSNVSANWNATDGTVELIETRTGCALQAQDSGLGAATSRLSKVAMLSRFASLTPGSGSIKYLDVKRSAAGYRKTQQELHKYLEDEKGLGLWQSKPNDYSQVHIEE